MFFENISFSCKKTWEPYQVCNLIVQGEALKGFQTLNHFLSFKEFSKLLAKTFLQRFQSDLCVLKGIFWEQIAISKEIIFKFYRTISNINAEILQNFFSSFLKNAFIVSRVTIWGKTTIPRNLTLKIFWNCPEPFCENLA